jgi:cytochrome P450
MVTRAFVIPDLVNPKTYLDHDMPEIWRRLRTEDPVYWHRETAAGPGFWAVTRHEDISAVLRDDKHFTSEKGNVLATMLQGSDMGGGRMLAVTDPPNHTGLRKLLLEAFAPRALADVVIRVRRTTRRLLMDAVDLGQCDFAQDIASVIPLETICDLLEVPAQDRHVVLKLTKSALTSDYESPDAHADREARREIILYFGDLLADRRKTPGSDPISLMATAEVNGRRLEDMDIILNCYSLILGGNETTRLAMIGAVRAFIENPDQWVALKSRKSALETAAEEVLRWTTPAMHFGRIATADIELRNRTISRNDIVTLWLAAGNRDGDVFSEPNRFDITRSPNRHLSLGYGRHFCLGAYLGRMEIKVMLDGLRTFASGIEQAGPERWIFSNFLSGMSSFPVALKRDPTGPSLWPENA